MTTTNAPKPHASKSLTFDSSHDLFDYVVNQLRPISVGMDTIFNDFNSGFRQLSILNTGWPKANIVETTTPSSEDRGEKTYVLELALAGIPKEDLKVELKDDTLTVSYEKGDQFTGDSSEGRRYLHQEVAYRSFVRSWRLGPDIEVTAAESKDGILSIGFRKSIPEKAQPRQIDIS
jgi:molecular chaperone IbpA